MPSGGTPEYWKLQLSLTSVGTPELARQWDDLVYRLTGILANRIRLTGRSAVVTAAGQEPGAVEFSLAVYPSVAAGEIAGIVADALRLPGLMASLEVAGQLLAPDGKLVRSGIGTR